MPLQPILNFYRSLFSIGFANLHVSRLIIVFCNRTGVEDQTTVYAGTSAVIGIHQGEVKVYGLLGRGVKELLIVDTDDSPFANLTIRKDGVHLSPVEYELKTSEHSDGTESLLFKPSPIIPGRRTPTKCFPGAAHSKSAPRSLPTEESHVTLAPTTFKAPTTGCADSTPSDESSPMSTATILQSSTQSMGMPSVQVEDLDAAAHPSPRKGRILGGRVEITFEDDQDISHGQAPSPSNTDALTTPPSRGISKGPQQHGNPRRQTTLTQHPGSAEPPRLREPSPRPQLVPAVPELYARTEKQSPLQGPPDVRNAVPSRPSTATGIRPPRPASPKSQNAKDVQGRSQSVEAVRRVFDTPSIRGSQRSPNSRSVSRSGRIVGLDQGLIERALDFYLGSKSVDIRDRIFAIDAHASYPGSRTDDDQSAYADFPGSSSLSDRSSASGSSAPSLRAVAGQSDADTAKMNSEFGSSRTVLWQEDSQIVGQHLRRPKSKEGVRGRRRSRGTSPTNDRRGSGADSSRGSTPSLDPSHLDDYGQSRNVSRSQTSRAQYESTDRRSSPSQFRPRNGDTIRSVRDPSLGPPSDSEDEIIAEITFRRPACRNCGSPNCGSKGANRQKTQDINSNGPGPASDQQKDKAPGPNGLMAPSPSSVDSEKTPTINKYQAAHSDPVRLALQTTSEELNELRAPNLSRASLRTLSSYEPSPVTPPPRHFEPRTPKAMVFNSDYAPTSIETASSLRFDAVDASLDNIISMTVERPKASV